MKPTLLAVALLLPMTSCMMNNHTPHSFPDRGGAPDIQAMEKARQENASKNRSGGLGDVSWYPLLALNAETYDASNDPRPKGTRYVDFESYGPLFMFADAEEYHYDEDQQVYEHNIGKSYLWGLYRFERNDVRVPSGWRYDEETSLLFGLMRWPSDAYVTNKADGQGTR
jgi:hypothetical protein